MRMLRRSALTWTDGGAGFTRSERASVRAGGEEPPPPAGSPGTPPAVVLSSVSRYDRVVLLHAVRSAQVSHSVILSSRLGLNNRSSVTLVE